jgi:hypothetical protein
MGLRRGNGLNSGVPHRTFGPPQLRRGLLVVAQRTGGGGGTSPQHRLASLLAAYYIASEALTNVAKHAQATVVHPIASHDKRVLTLEVRDDGIGGVDAGRGSGILGLTDRVEALGGRSRLRALPLAAPLSASACPARRTRAGHLHRPSRPATMLIVIATTTARRSARAPEPKSGRSASRSPRPIALTMPLGLMTWPSPLHDLRTPGPNRGPGCPGSA